MHLSMYLLIKIIHKKCNYLMFYSNEELYKYNIYNEELYK